MAHVDVERSITRPHLSALVIRCAFANNVITFKLWTDPLQRDDSMRWCFSVYKTAQNSLYFQQLDG